jgi:hypothetical protein
MKALMKNPMQHAILPSTRLAGMLFIPACSTPTTSIGAAPKSDRTVLYVSSPVATKIQRLQLARHRRHWEARVF